jgi:MobA/MobL family
MAKYFLRVKIFSRGKGSNAPKAAAYRAGERIRDEVSSAVHDYTDRADVAHAEIVLPSEHAENIELAWARNRSVLWNAVQRSGRQWNSRLAREVLVLLPPELDSARHIALTRLFSQELADRYGCAVDFAVHKPRAKADARHHHAHVLTTCRKLTAQGLGARTTLELSGRDRHQRGLGSSKDELMWTRARWGQLANEALRDAGLAADMDHRSYAAQNIDRESRAHIPREVFYARRRALEAQGMGLEAPDGMHMRDREKPAQSAAQARGATRNEKRIPTGAMSREQLKEKRREYHRANAAKINLRRREHYKVNAAEINRKHREYMRQRTAAASETKPALTKEPEVSVKSNSGALQRELPKQPDPLPTSQTAAIEPSVRRWLEYRETQKSIIRQDPIEKWKEYRQTRSQKAVATRGISQESEVASPSATASDAGQQKRGLKNDFSL